MSEYLRALAPLFEEADRLLGEYRPGRYDRLIQRVERVERAESKQQRKTAAAGKWEGQTKQRDTRPAPRTL